MPLSVTFRGRGFSFPFDSRRPIFLAELESPRVRLTFPLLTSILIAARAVPCCALFAPAFPDSVDKGRGGAGQAEDTMGYSVLPEIRFQKKNKNIPHPSAKLEQTLCLLEKNIGDFYGNYSSKLISLSTSDRFDVRNSSSEEGGLPTSSQRI